MIFHKYGFSLVCTCFTWLFKLKFILKAVVQNWHELGFSSVCTYFQWLWLDSEHNAKCSDKDLQCINRALGCTWEFSCLMRLPFLLNALLQYLQKYLICITLAFLLLECFLISWSICQSLLKNPFPQCVQE